MFQSSVEPLAFGIISTSAMEREAGSMRKAFMVHSFYEVRDARCGFRVSRRAIGVKMFLTSIAVIVPMNDSKRNEHREYERECGQGDDE